MEVGYPDSEVLDNSGRKQSEEGCVATRTEGSAISTAASVLAGKIEVVECGVAEAAAWDDFVARSEGTYCHLWGWRSVLERTYGLETRYLAFRSGDAWAGVRRWL